jgi:hypothetical protein
MCVYTHCLSSRYSSQVRSLSKKCGQVGQNRCIWVSRSWIYIDRPRPGCSVHVTRSRICYLKYRSLERCHGIETSGMFGEKAGDCCWDISWNEVIIYRIICLSCIPVLILDLPARDRLGHEPSCCQAVFCLQWSVPRRWRFRRRHNWRHGPSHDRSQSSRPPYCRPRSHSTCVVSMRKWIRS